MPSPAPPCCLCFWSPSRGAAGAAGGEAGAASSRVRGFLGYICEHTSLYMKHCESKERCALLFLDPWAVHTDIKYLLKTWISSEKVERKDRHIEGKKDANKKLRGMGAGWFRGCWVLQTLLLTDAGQSHRWLSRPGYRLCADEYGSLSLQ